MKKGKKEGEMKELGRDRKRGNRRRRKGNVKEKFRRDREGGYRREVHTVGDLAAMSDDAVDEAKRSAPRLKLHLRKVARAAIEPE